MPTLDSPSLTALLERYERPLVRYAASILGELEAARDAVQETFIRLVRLQAEGRHPAPEPVDGSPNRHLEAWLFTVCRNCAVDHQRKQARIIPMPTIHEERADEAPSPAASLEQSEMATRLFRLLDHLPPNQREVIRLKFQNDLSYKEIAEVTQLSVTNVGFLLHTGLKKLRALMAESPGETWPSAIIQSA